MIIKSNKFLFPTYGEYLELEFFFIDIKYSELMKCIKVKYVLISKHL